MKIRMGSILAFIMGTMSLASFGAKPRVDPVPHPSVGRTWAPEDVDWSNPMVASAFEDEAALKDWRLEGGKRMAVENGRLVLESEHVGTEARPGDNHLVCWLTKEMPADFLLEFKMRPKERNQGLAIVFFNARGLNGEPVFDPALAPRNGLFKLYHSGDLNNYHISYWAGGRGTAHVRKNRGFALVAVGDDLVASAPAEAFQTIRIYKRGGTVRLTVDGVISVAYNDDGMANGPVWTHPGWIALRQMGHTVRAEYDDLKVYPLLPTSAPAAPSPP